MIASVWFQLIIPFISYIPTLIPFWLLLHRVLHFGSNVYWELKTNYSYKRMKNNTHCSLAHTHDQHFKLKACNISIYATTICGHFSRLSRNSWKTFTSFVFSSFLWCGSFFLSCFSFVFYHFENVGCFQHKHFYGILCSNRFLRRNECMIPNAIVKVWTSSATRRTAFTGHCTGSILFQFIKHIVYSENSYVLRKQ